MPYILRKQAKYIRNKNIAKLILLGLTFSGTCTSFHALEYAIINFKRGA